MRVGEVTFCHHCLGYGSFSWKIWKLCFMAFLWVLYWISLSHLATPWIDEALILCIFFMTIVGARGSTSINFEDFCKLILVTPHLSNGMRYACILIIWFLKNIYKWRKLECPPWLIEIFVPLDILTLWGFSNKMLCEFSDDILGFDGYDDAIMIYVTLFMTCSRLRH